MSKNTILIIAAVSFADEKGIMRYAGEEAEVSQELLDEQNALCEKFDLPKHTVVEPTKQGKEAKPAAEQTAQTEPTKQDKEAKPAAEQTAKKADDL